MLRDVTIGQFFPGKSVLHRMDPRMKIILLLAYIVMIFITGNYFAVALMTVSVFALMLMSGVPVKMYFKSLKMIIFIVVFTSLLNLFYGRGEPIFELGFLKITQAGINNSIFIAIRIITLIIISSMLTFTTSPTELTDALERLLKPLKIFHIQPNEIAMMMTIALRFVPTLIEETDKIMNAQKARGADMESGGLMQRIKALIPVLIPLFVSAFRRAYDLAMAMECRCYRGGEGRTKMKSLKMKRLDYISLTASVLLCIGVILCNIYLPATIR